MTSSIRCSFSTRLHQLGPSHIETGAMNLILVFLMVRGPSTTLPGVSAEHWIGGGTARTLGCGSGMWALLVTASQQWSSKWHLSHRAQCFSLVLGSGLTCNNCMFLQVQAQLLSMWVVYTSKTWQPAKLGVQRIIAFPIRGSVGISKNYVALT